MNRYLIDLTFYAGSDAPCDTDRDVFILESEEKLTKEKVSELFKEANYICGRFMYKNEDEKEILKNAPLYDKTKEYASYEEGINIGTLIDTFEIYTGYKLKYIDSYKNEIPEITKIYKIEQWE